MYDKVKSIFSKLKIRKQQLLLVEIIAFLLVALGFSYAYFRLGLYGNETTSTLAISGVGKMKIRFENGKEITARDVLPGWSDIKEFTVYGTNTTNAGSSGSNLMEYSIVLAVEENSFSDNALEYSLELDEDNSNLNGFAAQGSGGIPTGKGNHEIGTGYFGTGEGLHKYKLTFSFPAKDFDQSSDMNKVFQAYITLSDEFTRPFLFADLDGGETSDDVFGKLYEEGTIITLKDPIKQDYNFLGWELVGESSSILNGNKLTMGSTKTIVKALWELNGVYLSFDLNGGSTISIIEDKEYVIGSVLNLERPQKKDYYFIGWSVDDDIVALDSITVDTSKSYKANYAKKVIDYNYVAPTTANSEPYDTFTAPIDGYYQLETWGAQGGVMVAAGSSTTGYGGYSIGNIYLKKGDKLYIYVGGEGNTTSSRGVKVAGGYNGGGIGYSYSGDSRGGASGGGATHVAMVSGLLNGLSNNLSEILVVSGGGGGSDQCCSGYSKTPGSGGGYVGVKGYYNNMTVYGGNQGLGGNGQYSGSFGQGGNCTSNDCAGGGGGYYGGAAGCGGGGFGSGGSGYIGSSKLVSNNRYMYCYNCEESSVDSTRTINTIGSDSLRDTVNCPNGYSSNPISKCAKTGNGHARITYVAQPVAFSTDEWETIAAAVKSGNTSAYHVGDTKQITIDDRNYTLRIANMSSPAECSAEGFSQTACGFVVEFANIYYGTDATLCTKGNGKCMMNPTATNIGGWPSAELRTYLNSETDTNSIYNKLKSVIGDIIADTYVVSGHGSGDKGTRQDGNWESTDKLYLLSAGEVYANALTTDQYDTASYQVLNGSGATTTRQLDYYAGKTPVAKTPLTSSNYDETTVNKPIKKLNNISEVWWLRAADRSRNNYFRGPTNWGYFNYIYATSSCGVAPAFRIE